MEKSPFNFEELEVWKKAVDFAKSVIDLTEEINTDRRHYRLIEQLEASSTSIALNIAEGKGRYSKKEFLQFLHIARGSLFETVTLLRIFHQKKWIDDAQLEKIEDAGSKVGKMISGLISSIRMRL